MTASLHWRLATAIIDVGRRFSTSERTVRFAQTKSYDGDPQKTQLEYPGVVSIIRTLEKSIYPSALEPRLLPLQILEFSSYLFDFLFSIAICASETPQNHHRLRSGSNRVGFPGSSLLLLHRPCSPALWVPLMSPIESHTAPPTKTVRCVIKGRVQGVFYRNWTVENATQLGLKGWVRNRRDGSVEALFSGKPEVVDEMQQRCHRGPPDAIVTGFEYFPSNDEEAGTGFERKPTV
ncbi:hypothetical protein Nepgr_025035 [Nepenthes gracilis]|uniref:acylphosphatase n=1 Tax=Nepenthes gracilis TaxID=150966 RepID=A0AAD3T712_NEPGR|nr:hypothetical protein Nepgr_025035 [Nepenthes gracilis]